MLRNTLLAVAVALADDAASADAVFSVANTFKDPQMTVGAETSTIEFFADVHDNQATAVGADVEIANCVNFCEIDVAGDISTLTMTVSDTVQPANNPMLADRFDCYYFTFTGGSPAAADIEADAPTAAIAVGATVAVTTTGRVVVAFGEGVEFTPSNKMIINLQQINKLAPKNGPAP